MSIPKDNDGLTSEVIALAWADEVSFDEIKERFSLTEADVIRIMRSNLKPTSFKLWRARVSGRKTKHRKILKQLNQAVDSRDETST